MFLGKGVPKICCKFAREHPCRKVISVKLLIALRHGCSENLLHIFKTPLPKNTSGQLLLIVWEKCINWQFVSKKISCDFL